MIRPTPDELETITNVARGHVRFVEYIRRCMTAELERLPKQQTNVSLFQGRAQVLQELHDALNPAAGKQPTTT